MKTAFRTTLMSVLLAIGVSACNVIPEPEQVRIYPLSASSVSAVDEVYAGTLRISQPTALLSLDGPRLPVYQTDGRQAYWQGVRLQDRVPMVVQDSLLKAVQQSGVVRHVVSDSSGSAYRHELQTHIEAFGVDSAAQPRVAVVRIRAQLREGGNRGVVASEQFSVQTEVTGDDVTSQMEALSTSMSELQTELIDWLARSL